MQARFAAPIIFTDYYRPYFDRTCQLDDYLPDADLTLEPTANKTGGCRYPWEQIKIIHAGPFSGTCGLPERNNPHALLNCI